jgi:hypothetical protein
MEKARRAGMKKRFVICAMGVASLALMSCPLAAQPPDSLWSGVFHFTAVDICYSVCETADGGYLLGGMTDGGSGPDLRLVKLNSSGDSLWSRTYGGSGSDICFSVCQASDGNYVAAGLTQSYGAGHCDFWLLKTNPDGDSLWSHTYGGLYNDQCRCVRETSDGGYILAGFSYSFSVGELDFWMVKTDENGDSLWSHSYGGPDIDECYCVTQTLDGGYVLAGRTRSFGSGYTDMWLVRTDANGIQLWSKAIGGDGGDECRFAQQTPDGGYILAGHTSSFDCNYSDFWLVKTDSNGDTLWSRAYEERGTEICTAAQVTADNGYILAGWTGEYDRQINAEDYWLVKTDAMGNLLWSRIFDNEEWEECNAVCQASDGGYILAGWTQTPHPLEQDFWAVKTGPEQGIEKPRNLTVYLNDGGTSPVLRWIAPYECSYLIYSTTNPNHTGNPPGTDWILEATLPNVPAGPAEWIHTNALTESYRNYVIVTSCP